VLDFTGEVLDKTVKPIRQDTFSLLDETHVELFRNPTFQDSRWPIVSFQDAELGLQSLKRNLFTRIAEL